MCIRSGPNGNPIQGYHSSAHVSADAGAHASVHEVVSSYVTWSVFTCSVPCPMAFKGVELFPRKGYGPALTQHKSRDSCVLSCMSSLKTGLNLTKPRQSFAVIFKDSPVLRGEVCFSLQFKK